MQNMQIEKIPVEKLQAAAYNPRKELKPGDPEYERAVSLEIPKNSEISFIEYQCSI